MKNDLSSAKNAVYRLLNYRPRSEYELKAKLKEKKFDLSVIDQTIEYFKNTGLVNDEDFAKAWVNSRLNKPFGINRIRRELLDKGIDKEILKKTLGFASEEYDELAMIRSLVDRKLQHGVHSDNDKFKQRIYNFLLRRGFGFSSIKKVIDQI
ncbi:MAG: regulatory protein RecX [Candidatus Omnitrophica bacterium]|nr:regulatory protein RecX [Candidatus Omnitrophota bacterium]